MNAKVEHLIGSGALRRDGDRLFAGALRAGDEGFTVHILSSEFKHLETERGIQALADEKPRIPPISCVTCLEQVLERSSARCQRQHARARSPFPAPPWRMQSEGKPES